MYPIHKFISIANLLCLTCVALFLFGGTGFSGLGISVFFGYFANLAAIGVGAATLLLIAVKARKGDGIITCKQHWLGIVNALAVVLAWSPVFLHMH